MTVEYFFVGPGKCGTSWLYEFIERHGLASVPSLKEPHIVDVDAAEAAHRIDTLYGSTSKMCDFSNTYSGDEGNAAKIRSYNPDAKIVVTCRLPSERIVSHYHFHVRSGADDVGLASFLADPTHRHVVDRSDYTTILERYTATFASDQILVLPLEQLSQDPQVYADRLAAFLGADRVVLGDEDLKKVLVRSRARSKKVAKLAMACSAWLRRRGLTSVLGALKRSSAINSVMFVPTDSVADETTMDFGDISSEVAALDASYPAFVLEHASFTVGS